jgi:hypothetical protein
MRVTDDTQTPVSVFSSFGASARGSSGTLATLNMTATKSRNLPGVDRTMRLAYWERRPRRPARSRCGIVDLRRSPTPAVPDGSHFLRKLMMLV